jgi:predicted transposase/invertase (TIGR01784 family)
MEKPVMKAVLEQTPEIQAAEERYQRFVADAELRDRLMARDKARRTHLQLLHDAEQKGKAEGIAEGKAEGKAEGITLGQQTQRRETAGKLKAKGMPPEEIAEIIDLPLEEIQGL